MHCIYIYIFIRNSYISRIQKTFAHSINLFCSLSICSRLVVVCVCWLCYLVEQIYRRKTNSHLNYNWNSTLIHACRMFVYVEDWSCCVVCWFATFHILRFDFSLDSMTFSLSFFIQRDFRTHNIFGVCWMSSLIFSFYFFFCLILYVSLASFFFFFFLSSFSRSLCTWLALSIGLIHSFTSSANPSFWHNIQFALLAFESHSFAFMGDTIQVQIENKNNNKCERHTHTHTNDTQQKYCVLEQTNGMNSDRS